MPNTNMLDDVATDLALWIDQVSTDIATAFVANHAPFSATVTEEQKLEYYRSRLFNPDGSPNPVGREAELQRLGISGFTQVYRALINRYPELRVPTPSEAPDVLIPEQWPASPGAPGAPPGPPGGPAPAPGGMRPPMPGPPGAVPPRPPIMPPGR